MIVQTGLLQTGILRAALLALLVVVAGRAAGEPARIISTNMCLDQLLVDFAAPDRIAGLSPYARDPLRSWVAARARAFPVLSGTAEEILVLKPDLVLSDRFDALAMRAFLRAKHVRIEEFDAPVSIAGARAQMLRVGMLVGAEERAAARVAELDAAVEKLAEAGKANRLRVLPLARRGWVAGRHSLLADLMEKAGLANASAELGFANGGFASLETVVMLRPDAILVTQDTPRAEDQGSALLLHPAIAALFPPERRLVMPERLTVCGGPMLSEAIEVLARQLGALKARP